MQSPARTLAALLLALAALALGLSTPAAPLLALVAIVASAEPAPARATVEYTDSEYLAFLLANEPRGVRYA
jgi:hypothetical protein